MPVSIWKQIWWKTESWSNFHEHIQNSPNRQLTLLDAKQGLIFVSCRVESTPRDLTWGVSEVSSWIVKLRFGSLMLRGLAQWLTAHTGLCQRITKPNQLNVQLYRNLGLDCREFPRGHIRKCWVCHRTNGVKQGFLREAGSCRGLHHWSLAHQLTDLSNIFPWPMNKWFCATFGVFANQPQLLRLRLCKTECENGIKLSEYPV